MLLAPLSFFFPDIHKCDITGMMDQFSDFFDEVLDTFFFKENFM